MVWYTSIEADWMVGDVGCLKSDVILLWSVNTTEKYVGFRVEDGLEVMCHFYLNGKLGVGLNSGFACTGPQKVLPLHRNIKSDGKFESVQ